MKTNAHFGSHLAQLFLEWEILQANVVEEIKTHILCSITFLENRAVYVITWKNITERGRPHMTIWCMRIVCWIPKATNTHWEYAIFFCFSTATMVTRTLLSVTLYVPCLSCLYMPRFLEEPLTMFCELCLGNTGLKIYTCSSIPKMEREEST